MMTSLANKKPAVVARPLRVLIPLIQDDLQKAREASNRAAEPHYRAAGEKLLEAKSQMVHGEFRDWARRHFNVADRQLSYYMKLAKQNGAVEPFLTVSEMRRATEPSYGPRPQYQPWHEPVKQIIDRVDTETLNLKREELKRVDERDAQRTLALQLIDIGYKVLARTLHPDKGGSRDAMARLNAVRDRLKQHA
jgi:hypothetical protein